jgi:hypothetical protein
LSVSLSAKINLSLIKGKNYFKINLKIKLDNALNKSPTVMVGEATRQLGKHKGHTKTQ